MDGVRSKNAGSILEQPVSYAGFAPLAKAENALLVTYKRDGTGIPTPVWFGMDGSSIYVMTEINAFKAKRLRRDKRVLLAPCTVTGDPLGGPIAGHGVVLTNQAEREHAAQVLKRSWGIGKRLFHRSSQSMTELNYMKFVPVSSEEEWNRPA